MSSKKELTQPFIFSTALGLHVKTNTNLPENRIAHYGGQALIEGVLMRGKNFVVAAMRKPDKTIHVEYEKLEGIYTSNLIKIPFLRGLVNLLGFPFPWNEIHNKIR